MIQVGCWCWFGIGLLLFESTAGRSKPRRRLPQAARWSLRAFGLAALAASAWAFDRETRGPLALVGALLALMAVSSVAALLAPLRPRLYAATIPLAALLAAACWLGR